MTNCGDSADLEVLKIDIEQTITKTCGNAQTNAELNLTTDSYWDGGDVDWTVNTNGLEGIDTSVADVFSFDPSASTQGQYVVTARSSILSNCYDIATVNVYRVELVPPSTNLCWWSTNEFTFTLTNSYWGSAGIEWVGTNDLGVTSVDNDHLRIEPNSSTAKSYTVRAQIEGMTNCGDSADLEVLKIDVDQIDATLCWELTNVTLNLTTDSYDGGGGVTWTSSPSGLSPAFGSGNTLTFNPSNSVPTSYVVTAASSLLPSCTDSCVVDVIKVDIDETNEYKCVSMTNATLNLTDDSYSPDGYAWTWPSSDLSGSASGDTFTYNPSNSTPGTYVVECASSNLTSCSDTCIVNVLSVDSVDVHANDTDTHKIAAVSGATHDDHFVCVKDTGDIILDATLSPNTTAAADAITWEADGATITSPAVGTDKTTAKLTSATSKRIPVRIKVGSCTCWEGIVWVAWSTVGSSPIAISTKFYSNRTKIEGGYDFEHTITPASLVDGSTGDIPNLKDGNDSDPPDASGADVYRSGVDLSGGADHKWDVSRQAIHKIVNPSNIPFTNNHDALFYTTKSTWPSDEVCGNDDKWTTDPEDNDPYTAPDVGKLTGTDSPNRQPYNFEGSVGDTFQIRYHMREFTRLELDGNWYKASDSYIWRIHIKFEKADENADNQDYNSDGDKDDVLWIDNGSDKALDHVGF
jgi:hypothetical protein